MSLGRGPGGGEAGALKCLSDPCPHPITPGLNERRTDLGSLERLQEEVARLWIELRVSNGECLCAPRIGRCACQHRCVQWLRCAVEACA